ncbi:MAG: hypothetical protein P8J87_18690, partial [Verrucomicrobiales bacterium]|nr:hypothetical protein [Verrucomicrobiales bacterium]
MSPEMDRGSRGSSSLPNRGKRQKIPGESPRHLALKHAAFRWARENGYRSVAFEVTLPSSNFRADVAAY